MKRLRVLELVHADLVPPDSIEGMSDREINPFKAEFDVRAALRELGHDVRVLGIRDELAPIRTAIEEFRPHVAFNLLTHFHGVSLYVSSVASYLELLKQPYTGCNPRGLLLADDKVLAKKILAWHRIPVPRFAVFRRGRAVRRPAGLEFPLFVKSSSEHASWGISQASIVRDEVGLAERVAFVHERIGTDALVESYIEGRELYVAVLGNRRLDVFPIWELSFERLPEGSAPIATDYAKWNFRYRDRVGVTTGPAADLDAGTTRAIVRLARRIYRALGLSGYARIDLRLDAAGRVWVLEANPNADISYGEDLADSVAAAGVDYPRLIQRILSLGLRYEAPWKSS